MMGVNRNLYRKDVYRNRKGLIIWSAILIGITIMILAIFPLMSSLEDEMTSMMNEFSDGLNDSMGYSSAMWSDILMFYSSYYGVYIIMLMSIYGTFTASGIIAKEERNQTSEFLYTRPITRKEIFWSKFMVVVTLLGVIFLLQSLIGLACVYAFKTAPVQLETLMVMNAHGFILVLFFACLGWAMPLLLNTHKNLIGPVLGIVFGLFFIDAISKAVEAVNWLGYISPFHYLGVQPTTEGLSFGWLPALVLILIAAGLVLLSIRRFEKKDIVG